MLSGSHVLIFTANPDADAAFLRDVLALPHVDAGEGHLIFGLPPTELAVHEADAGAGKHELYLITDDIKTFVAAMSERSIACDPAVDRGWGVVSSVTLPSGQKLGVYEPHHARPTSKKAEKHLRKAAKAVRKATKKVAKKNKKAAKGRKTGH